MKRFEALVYINDVRQLKAQLMLEVAELRQLAEERQKTWDETCRTFSQKVDSVERQLMMTREEASLDPLTRIGNRGAFDREYERWIEGRHRQFVLVMIDVDHFKGINDTDGHAVGDRALIAVAQALKNAVRANGDFVARLGGDEFAVLVSNLPLHAAEARIRWLASSLSSVPFETSNTPLKLTLSCGVAEFSAGDNARSLMERADEALYEAKRLGRNCVVGRAKSTLRELMNH